MAAGNYGIMQVNGQGNIKSEAIKNNAAMRHGKTYIYKKKEEHDVWGAKKGAKIWTSPDPHIQYRQGNNTRCWRSPVIHAHTITYLPVRLHPHKKRIL